MPLVIGTPTADGRRVAAAIAKAMARAGYTVTYGRGISTYSVKGRLSISLFSEYSSRFTSADTSAWLKPVYLLRIAGEFVVPGGGAAIVGDTVQIPATNRSSTGAADFVTYYVKGIFYDYYGDVITMTRLFLART